jgi:glutamate-1-semialdehyde 2,1-aminomutase
MPAGVNSAQRNVPGIEDLVVRSSAGSTFTDADGRTFTDYHAAYGAIILGHNDPDVDAALASTSRELDLIGCGVARLEVELAERLVDLIPSFERVLLTTTGSEATFYALRLARAATGRSGIIKFQGCYHGWHDAVCMNVISPADRVGAHDIFSSGLFPGVAEATTVLPFNDLDVVRDTLEARASEIAAVILEPIPHNIGTVLPRPGFLEGLRELCTRHGVVLIFDEVVTGFRHSLGGYQRLAGVTPDLTTIGKALANGYPIAAVGGRADLMDLFTVERNSAFFGGTFYGHPATVAAALANLEKIEREDIYAHTFALGERARTELNGLFQSLEVPAVVAGLGSVFVTYFLEPPIESYDDLLRNDVDLFVGYRLELLQEGIFELPLNLKRNHFSYAHTDRDVDNLVAGTERAVQRVLDRRSGRRASATARR